MDYQKIDAALAAALEEIQDPKQQAFAVFIRTVHAPNHTEAEFLEELGVRGVGGQRQVFTATLSAHAIGELSDQPWLQYVKLSRRLRLLDDW